MPERSGAYLTTATERARVAAYAATHKDEISASHKAYYAAHRREVLTKNKKYRAANLEAGRIRKKAYAAAHQSEIAASRHAHYLANRDRIQAQHKAYRAAHVDEYRAQQAAYYIRHKEAKARYDEGYRRAHPEVSLLGERFRIDHLPHELQSAAALVTRARAVLRTKGRAA